MAIGMVRRARAGSGPPPAGPALAPIAADAEHAARLALAASVAAGNPLSPAAAYDAVWAESHP
jgi:hypothetical protein